MGTSDLMRMARVYFERFILLCSDVFSLCFSLYVFLDVKDLAGMAGTPPVLSLWMQQDTASHFIAYLSAATLVIYWLFSRGHYSKRLPFWADLGQLFGVLLTGFFTEIGLTVLLSHQAIDWPQVIGSWLTAMLCLPAARVFSKYLMLRVGLWHCDSIIVGVGENSRQVHAALKSEFLMGYRVKWFGLSPSDSISKKISSVNILGDEFPVIDLTTDAAGALSRLDKPQVVVALDRVISNEEFVNQLGAVGTNILVFPSMRGLPLQGVEVSHFFGAELLMLRLQNNLLKRGSRIAKRFFDAIISVALLIFLFPLFLVLILVIRRDGGGAFYGHDRIGLSGRPFRCLKFRSMVANSDHVLRELLARDENARLAWESDFKLKDDPRITSLGEFIRKTSIDELPQLINVLRGDMSLVGPRPIVQDELGRYSEKAAYYLQVRPGITGLWQVSGRNDVDYSTRVELDVWYVKNWSLWTDIVILLKTIRVVVFRIGAY